MKPSSVEALSNRMITALYELVSSVKQNNGVGAESINILNELQTILLTLMLPYILPILDFTQEADAESGESISVNGFISQIVLLLTKEPSNLLSYSACLRAYDQAALTDNKDNNAKPKFDFTQKNVTLAFLHALNLIQMRSAFMELTIQLSSSTGSANNLAGLMANATAFSVESAIGNIQSQLPLLLLKDVINTVLGSANDGISHLAAAVDSLWDSMRAQQKTPAEIVKTAFDLVAPMMVVL